MVFAFVLTFSILEWFDYCNIKNGMIKDIRSEARHLRGVLMATRRVYHHQFIKSGVPLTDRTLGFLPAHSMSLISEDFSNWTDDKLYFNNVSDRPRNQRNTADSIEKEAIVHFRENPTEKERFVPFNSTEGEAFYHYSAPIWVEEYCLKCHGKKEDAPATIRSSYDTSYNYEAGDLRGVMSIKLPATQLNELVWANFMQDLWVHLSSFTGIFLLIAFLLYRYVTVPLSRIKEGLSSVGEDLSYKKIDGLSGEMAVVGNTFNEMSERLIVRESLLKESEERLRAIIDNSTAVIYLKDINGEYLLINSQYENLFNISNKGIIGKTDYDIFPKDIADKLIKNDQEVIDNKGSFTFEETLPHDDELNTYISVKFPLLDQKNKAYGVCGISTDITERKKMEETLILSEQKSEEKVLLLLNSTGEAIYGIDLEGNCTFCNPSCLLLLGYENEKQLLDQHMHSLIHHTRKDGTPYPVEECCIYQAFREGKGSYMDGEVLWCADGTSFEAEYRSFPIIRDDKTVGAVVSFVDITERKRIEREVKALNESLEQRVMERTADVAKLSQAIKYSSATVIITDTEGIIEYANPIFSKLTGYSVEEVIGKNPRFLQSGKTPSEVYEELWSTIKSGDEWKGEFCNKKKNGELYWEYVSISPVKDDKGVITNYIAVKDDITERRKMEEALLQAEKLKSIVTITAGISHEFNNLLAIISSNVQLLEATYKDDRVLTAALRTIMKASDDGSEITSNMLKFTKTYQGTKELESTCIRDMIEQSIDFTKPRWKNEAQAKGIDYKMDTEEMKSVPYIMCKHSEIREIFTNLINNALDAMPKGGKISFRTWSVDDAVLVSITDNGGGMSENVKRNIFDPFFSTKGVEGTGLGMSIVYGIVTRHGGNIDVASKIGKGTTFTLQFPIPTIKKSQIEALKHEQETNVKNLHILVVDDEEAIRNILEQFLSRDGHTVKTVDNGAEAINMVEGEDFDLVLSDLAMPNVFGYDVVKAIDGLEKRPKIGIITGWNEEHAPADKEIKVDFYLKKPFKKTDLTKHINDAFGMDNK